MKSVFVAASSFSVISSVAGEISADALCQSACGLIASADDCKLVVAKGNNCANLQRDASGKFVYELGNKAGYTDLSVTEAHDLVMAEENNCFAMYYDVPELRSSATYCDPRNICPNLYWDKLSADNAGPYTYKYFTEGAADVNTLSPVMCDYASAEKPHQVDENSEFDACKALCHLNHIEEDCANVHREGNICIRLFWDDISRTSTTFSTRVAAGAEIAVTVREARDLLVPNEETCESLCKKDDQCKKSESHCSDNKTCKGLFFQPGTEPVKSALKVCFGAACKSELSPVLCGVSEIAPLVPQQSTAHNDAPRAIADARVGNSASMVSGVVAMVVVSLMTFF